MKSSRWHLQRHRANKNRNLPLLLRHWPGQSLDLECDYSRSIAYSIGLWPVNGSRPSPRPRVGLHLFFISKFPDFREFPENFHPWIWHIWYRMWYCTYLWDLPAFCPYTWCTNPWTPPQGSALGRPRTAASGLPTWNITTLEDTPYTILFHRILSHHTPTQYPTPHPCTIPNPTSHCKK